MTTSPGPLSVAADLTPAAATHIHLTPGQQVWAAVQATETRAYPAGRHGSEIPARATE